MLHPQLLTPSLVSLLSLLKPVQSEIQLSTCSPSAPGGKPQAQLMLLCKAVLPDLKWALCGAQWPAYIVSAMSWRLSLTIMSFLQRASGLQQPSSFSLQLVTRPPMLRLRPCTSLRPATVEGRPKLLHMRSPTCSSPHKQGQGEAQREEQQ